MCRLNITEGLEGRRQQMIGQHLYVTVRHYVSRKAWNDASKLMNSPTQTSPTLGFSRGTSVTVFSVIRVNSVSRCVPSLNLGV